MGIIRMLLALAVVGTHSNSHLLLKFVGGEVAVQAFYIISGFYMAMVFGNYDSKIKFWKSRYLRLYPTYILCALLSFLLLRGGWAGAQAFLSSSLYPLSAKVFIAFTNLTIVFQDVTLFLGMKDGELFFTKNFGAFSPAMYEFLWVQQGWSLGLELTFYLLVPFILNRSTKVMVALMGLSLAARVVLQSIGYSADPWSYRFFPSELALFLLGSVAYRVHADSPQKLLNEHGRYLLFGATVLFLLFFPFVPLELQLKKIIFYLLLAAALGVSFDLTKHSRLDNFVGALSYPMYCVHMIVLGYLLPKITFIQHNGEFWNTVLIYVLIALASAFIYLVVEKPIEIFRRRYKHVKESGAPMATG